MKPNIPYYLKLTENKIDDKKITNVNNTGPRYSSSIPVRSHSFAEIDHEIISTVIAVSYKKGCSQFQAKVCAQLLVPACPGKSVVR